MDRTGAMGFVKMAPLRNAGIGNERGRQRYVKRRIACRGLKLWVYALSHCHLTIPMTSMSEKVILNFSGSLTKDASNYSFAMILKLTDGRVGVIVSSGFRLLVLIGVKGLTFNAVSSAEILGCSV